MAVEGQPLLELPEGPRSEDIPPEAAANAVPRADALAPGNEDLLEAAGFFLRHFNLSYQNIRKNRVSLLWYPPYRDPKKHISMSILQGYPYLVGLHNRGAYMGYPFPLLWGPTWRFMGSYTY